ncbi:metal ABC transporter substrate-binding protein [Pseudokineococcus sp. 1T1Z-3]|uniref:metal ABC transporter substrate-binding protein n=1 Tax=Pseudokineococcus sp. 1T1Z-3 TaxID=3132745 RepID=UPI0030A5B061
MTAVLPPRRRPPSVAAATALGAALALGACGGSSAGEASGPGGALTVVASPPALLDLLHQVGGEQVHATGPAPAGADAHALELSSEQVAALVDADLVVHVAGLAPSVDEAVSLRDGATVDAMDLPGARPQDPHVWLDPAIMAVAAGEIAEALAELDPEGRDQYVARGEDVGQQVHVLDDDLAEQLAPCRGAVLVVAHEAFGYLADRYGLQQVGITGIDPGVEPTPARLRDVAEQVRTAGAETIYFDDVTSTGVAQTLAQEVGASTAVLDPLETSVDPDYATAMRQNGQTLREGLVCDA